jgi:hypothetical protein
MRRPSLARVVLIIHAAILLAVLATSWSIWDMVANYGVIFGSAALVFIMLPLVVVGSIGLLRWWRWRGVIALALFDIGLLLVTGPIVQQELESSWGEHHLGLAMLPDLMPLGPFVAVTAIALIALLRSDRGRPDHPGPPTHD